jgi:HSP20 family protein
MALSSQGPWRYAAGIGRYEAPGGASKTRRFTMATGKPSLPVRRTPFGDIADVQETLRDMLDIRWPFGPRVARTIAELQEPAIDMFERNGNLVVKAEMPGIEPEKIEVTVAAGELRISGERSEEKEVKEEDYYRAERRYGRVFRSVTLPEGCDAAAVTATSKDGVVEIVIPRKAAEATKKVEVKAK